MSDLNPAAPLDKVLAIDTSTDRLSIALGSTRPGGPVWTHEGVGGAQASVALLPAIQGLLAEAGWSLRELDAIAFGCGPGSFTGLRTACAVVQGLAVAARPGGIPVVPVNTLWAVAEEGRLQWLAQGGQRLQRVVAVLDARMDEMYVAELRWTADEGPALEWHAGPWLSGPEALTLSDGWPGTEQAGPAPLLVGNAMAVYGERLAGAWQACPQVLAWPSATAMLRLVPALVAQFGTLEAAQAQPLYVRDKVAQTTQEREWIKAQKMAAAAHEPSGGR